MRGKKNLGVLTREEPEESPKETWEDLLTRLTGVGPRVCPFCGQGKIIRREILVARVINVADKMPRYAGCPP